MDNLQITAKHYQKNEQGVDVKLKGRIEKKVEKLQRLLPSHAKKSLLVEAVIDELHKKIGGNKFKFELKFDLPGKVLVANSKAKTEGAALDLAEQKMVALIAKYKTQHNNKKLDRKDVSKIRKFLRKLPNHKKSEQPEND